MDYDEKKGRKSYLEMKLNEYKAYGYLKWANDSLWPEYKQLLEDNGITDYMTVRGLGDSGVQTAVFKPHLADHFREMLAIELGMVNDRLNAITRGFETFGDAFGDIEHDVPK